MRTVLHRRPVVGVIVLALVASLCAVAAATPTEAFASASADVNPGDGVASSRAGASCWGIKQAYPSSVDGVYWVDTGVQDRPLQVYCDMTTDGGGWVLIGRGREGWSFLNRGQGTQGAVRTTVTGSGAFAPAALPTATVDELLGGLALDALPDGIRVERATVSAGTSYQELRLVPAYGTWSWSMPSGKRLSAVRVDGVTYANGNTRETASAFYDYPRSGLQGLQGYLRLTTVATSANAWKAGFGFGTGVVGSTASTDFVYKTATGTALPFTRVWLRPQLDNGAITREPIPDEGYPEDPNPANLRDTPEVARYGVVGLNHTGEASIEPWNTTVNVVKAYGERVYLGGRFTNVQQGPSGMQTPQASLAAFDLDGNWIETFRPAIAGRVWDMTMTRDGKLIIGGDFTSVNGAPNTSALAALDPNTGQVIPTWHANVTHTTSTPIVRGLDSRGDWVYAAGRFNRVHGGTWNILTVSRAVSLRASDGTPGPWRPRLPGTAVRIRVSDAGDRVYLAGYFNAINGDTNHGYHGITNSSDGTPVSGVGPWQPSTGSSAKYQQAVAELDGMPMVGGSEHDLQIYDHDRTTLLDSHITRQGGDFQTIEIYGTEIYAGCHCADNDFEGTNSYSSPRGFRDVEPINHISRYRWDGSELQVDTTWKPDALKGYRNEGVWSTAEDGRGCLWVGGDLTKGNYTGVAATDWLGGFGRFCPTDTTPPTAPSGLTATTASGGVDLTWTGSTDTTGAVRYDVVRNGRVLATVGGTSYHDVLGEGSTANYTVRATDTAGNRSASPAPVEGRSPAPELATPVPFGSTWRSFADGTGPGDAWTDPGFDDSGWATGTAPFGWGIDAVTTILAARPLTSYHRTSFDVADPAAVGVLQLELFVNAGAVVHVNGVEAGRVNMPTGRISATTTASSYVCCGEEARIKTVSVPRSVLRPGGNLLAVELHAWSATAGRAAIDVRARLIGPTPDATAPGARVVSASATPDGVNISWSAVSDDGDLAGYLLERDGAPLAVTAPDVGGWIDTDVTPSSDHTYELFAFDSSGNVGPASAVAVHVPADPTLLPFASTWSWWLRDTAPVGAWTVDGYDDSGWAVGPGPFGYPAPKGTVISTAPVPRPLVSYYRTTVEVEDPAAYRAVLLELVRNSGAAVYVNGVEVARSNLPSGTLTFRTYAVGPIPAAQRSVPVTFEVPAALFRAGRNTIAAELHLGYRSQPTAGFDVQLTGIS